jgi:plasmid maintenance system antidote protein VapI
LICPCGIVSPMTQLRTYLKTQGITQAAFAKQADLNQATVSKLCAGTIGASLPTALRIERLTGGAVPVSALLRHDMGGADESRKGAA